MNEQFFGDAISRWRAYVERYGSLPAPELDVLEDRLSGQAGDLRRLGLSTDEAFQVAVQRIGRDDEATRAFVQDHAAALMGADLGNVDTRGPNSVLDRAGKLGPVAAPDVAEIGEEENGGKEAGAASGGGIDPPNRTVETALVLCLAAGAALAIKVPALFGVAFGDDDVNQFYALNISFFAFPFVTAYFAWKRRMTFPCWGWLIPPYFVVLLLCNIYPYSPGGDTAVLTTLHAPVALWLVVGYVFVGGNWRSHGLRMDFVRFSGQLFILFVLIALGGGVLTGITLTLFNALGVNLQWVAASWIIPCGAMGAIVVAAWLVHTGQGSIEHVAPVLTRIFTPLFTLMLLSFLAVLVWTGRGIHVQREMLIAFDVLLIIVLGLVLYSVSARDPDAPPGVFDSLQIALIIAAIIVDAFVLASMTARITEFGFTPNRLCAIGLNLILFVNLAWTAWLYIGFMRGWSSFPAVERWQTGYLPVFSAWALFVVAVFPLVFGFN